MTFGYMTAGRTCLSDKRGKTVAPGPGTYDAKQSRTGQYDLQPAHGKAGKCLLTYNAEVPGHRVPEDPGTTKSRALVPGPGSYDAKKDKTGNADVQPMLGKHGMCLLTYNLETPGHRLAEDPGTTKSRAFVPGPGSYDAKFDKTGHSDVQPSNGKAGMCLLTYNEDTPGHRMAEDPGTTKSRAVVPGPGSYDAKLDKTGHSDVQPSNGKPGMCLLTYNEETPGHRVPEDPGTTKSRAIVPGPGSYDAKKDKTGNADVQPILGKHGMCLLTYNEDTPGHRMAEDPGTTKSRAFVPGPGSYDSKVDRAGHTDTANKPTFHS